LSAAPTGALLSLLWLLPLATEGHDVRSIADPTADFYVTKR